MTKIQMITELNSAISADLRDEWAVPEELPASQANLAYLLDLADYRRIEAAAYFGDIGSGTTSVYFVDGNKRTLLTPENEDNIFATIRERGHLTRKMIREISGDVWDGNSHRIINANRSEKYCDEPDDES